MSAGSVAILVFSGRGHGRFVSRWVPAESPTLEFTAEKDATYHLQIGYGDAWSLAPQLYSFSYEVAPGAWTSRHPTYAFHTSETGGTTGR